MVAICGLVILFFGMNFLKGLNLFSSANKYYISFKGHKRPVVVKPDLRGWIPGGGVVKAIKYDYNKAGDIIVETDINEQLRIPKGSSAEIISDMLGNVKINLLLATNPRERVTPGDTIQGGINDGALGKMKNMIPTVAEILPKIDTIVTNLNILLATLRLTTPCKT